MGVNIIVNCCENGKYLSISIDCRIIDPLRDIGRGDLDPLNRGGGGGGMLFNPPFNNPNLFQPLGPDRNPLPGIVVIGKFIITLITFIALNMHSQESHNFNFNFNSKFKLQALYQVHDLIHLDR